MALGEIRVTGSVGPFFAIDWINPIHKGDP